MARYNVNVYSVRADCQYGAVSLLLQVEYLLCYACAGSMLQFCAVPRDSSVARLNARPPVIHGYTIRPAVYHCCCYPSVSSHQSAARAAS